MIRVLIVEDEPPTLRRISAMLTRVDPSFTVVATALNGEIALEKLETTGIDLVITDIRMPVMGGVELMAKVREKYPSIMIAVLSGHQDFEYAAHAMRARSIDYLLKPVSEEAMAQLLARVKEQHARASRERLYKSISMHLNKSEPAPRADGEEALVWVSLFLAGAFPLSDDAEMYPAADFWNDPSIEALAAEESPDFSGFSWAFMGDTPVERIFIAQSEGAPEIAKMHARLSGGVPLSCAHLRAQVPLSETGDAIRALRRALRAGVQIGRGVYIELDRIDAPLPEEEYDDSEDAARLAKRLSSGSADMDDSFTAQLFGRMEAEAWTQRRVLRLMRSAAEGLGVWAVLSDAVCTALSLEELRRAVAALAPLSDAGRQGDVPEAIERYLRAHYAEHITNQMLAAEFGYVPSYISALFRQKYGVSPSEYLTQIRLNEAKALIREHPDMLIREVAERVGFKSQHHFSRIFKKNEGMRPTNY